MFSFDDPAFLASMVDPLWIVAGAAPAFDLPFARNRSLVDAVTGQSLIAYTQEPSGTYVNSDRVITTAASNEPRFDHDPTTGESLGLLVEEQRINSIRNNTMVGAAPGAPGTLPQDWPFQAATNGLAVSITETNTESGIAYLGWRITGTTTAFATADISFERTAALTGQTWTSSVYVRLAAGSLSAVTSTFLRIVEEDASSNVITRGTGEIPLPTTNSLVSQRSSFSRTLSGGATVALVRTNLAVSVASGATVDFTLRIGLPQLEQGGTASSVIPTAGAAVTRAASFADLISSAIANNIRSFYVEFRSPAVGVRGVVSLNDNTANERASVITSGTDPRLVVVDGGIEQANINGGTVSAGVRTRVAVRINNNDFAISVNGGAVVTDTSGTLPTVDRIMLGRTQAGEFLNGSIARFTGWNELLSNATLQALAGQ